MSERVSSSLTFFYKFIFTSVWVLGFGFGTITVIVSPNEALRGNALFFGVTWVLGSTFLLWSCGRLKRVEISNGNIVISNYFKIATVEGHEIDTVTQNRFINIRSITIRLKKETVFGRRIVFMPKFTFRIFSENPVVSRLRRLGARPL